MRSKLIKVYEQGETQRLHRLDEEFFSSRRDFSMDKLVFVLK